MSARSVESTSTTSTLSPVEMEMRGQFEGERRVAALVFAESSPLIQTVEAVITPSKSTKTRLPLRRRAIGSGGDRWR